MTSKDFDAEQQQAFLDLAVLAMYADGHLAAMEDGRVQQLLAAMGHESDYDRCRHYDAAVARVREYSQTVEGARGHAVTLAKSFATPAERQHVLKFLDDLFASDGGVSSRENSCLEAVREAFKM
jgi:tellurite resistance protein